MNKDRLFKLFEIINSKMETNEEVPKEIIGEICAFGSNLVGLAQINPKVGDVEYNAKKIEKYIKIATDLKLKFIAFPELSLVGCPLEDAVGRFPVIAENGVKWLNRLANMTKDTTVFVGFLEPVDNKYYNSIAILRNGEIVDVIRKSSTVNPFGFNDYKYITSGHKCFVNYEGYGVTIGEDECKIVSDMKAVVNCCAVPSVSSYQNKNKEFASKKGLPYIYVNQAGTIDSVSFAGSSSIYGADGNLIARAKAFEEYLLIADYANGVGQIYNDYDFKKPESFSLDYEQELERIYKIIIQGIMDYFVKCGLKRAVLGLSGGLDSTVCAVLLADALGKENVLGVSMPSKISTAGSKIDAEALAKNLGIKYVVAPIGEMVDTTNNCFNKLFDVVESGWDCRYQKSYTMDNIQARSRAMYLWGISNEFASCIPIATSDKSEIYMGYATVNGDMSGGFAPIADITKTKLFALARWLNKNRAEKDVIPETVLLKRPGAELAIDPNTGKPLCAEDALMPYEFMDEVIWRIENKQETYMQMLYSEFVYEKNNVLTREQKREWLDKFFKRMSGALYKWTILAPAVTLEENSILNKNFRQMITSCSIDYKG